MDTCTEAEGIEYETGTVSQMVYDQGSSVIVMDSFTERTARIVSLYLKAFHHFSKISYEPRLANPL